MYVIMYINPIKDVAHFATIAKKYQHNFYIRILDFFFIFILQLFTTLIVQLYFNCK